MVVKYPIKAFLTSIILIILNGFTYTFAQAPNITYPTPKSYTINTPIPPLSPVNTGGAVPATIYGQVSTFAGSGLIGSANGLGTIASFYNPQELTVDNNDNIYVADFENNQIREISVGDNVSTFPTSTSTFNRPYGITVDANKTIYVTSGQNQISSINSYGTVTTLPGSGLTGALTGIAVDGSGNIYVADATNSLIRKITATGIVSTFAGTGFQGSVNGTGTQASFNTPEGLTIDGSGNLYVADSGNNLIRMITPAGVVTTLAGNGASGSADGPESSASFNSPVGIAFDAAGNLYVTDALNNSIRKITQNGIVSTIAGSRPRGSADGVGAVASFFGPTGIGADSKGDLFIADSYNNLIRKVITTGYTIDKPLPDGLTFDPKTGIINGTPVTETPATIYTITAYNVTGSSSTQVSIETIVAPPTITYQKPQI